jgi:ribose/xylose/arabinose/galactoside ABC-type transport system permease subunit
MKRFLQQNSPLVILAVLCIFFAVASESFRDVNNLQQVALRTCVIAIMAVGQVLVILTAGIDLSVGSVVALSGVVAAITMKDLGAPVPVGVVAGTATGLVCGTINGTLSAKLRIPPFIVTLGMMMAARGLALIIADAQPIFGLPENFMYLGGGKGWWIPVLIMIAIVAVMTVLLSLTRFGRSLYAIGGNLGAARLSGIPTDRMRIAAFALCGLLAGFAGVMHASYIRLGSPTEAVAYELDAIAACVIGGTSLMGGQGTAVGAMGGALIMMVLVNICNLNDISVYWQQVFVGSLIVILVGYDNWRKYRAGLLKDDA